jgi:hypothetical protein
MRTRLPLVRLSALASVLLLAACQDSFEVTAPQDGALQVQQNRSAHSQSEIRGWAARAVPEVMALPHTVFASVDETDNVIVFGISNANAMFGLHRAMEQLGIPATGYRVQMTEPIQFMNTGLRTAHRPVIAGLQLHWDQYVCTLGFNVDHTGGRSFITNSHCTSNQGSTGTTAYHQPTRSGSATPVAREAHDPSYSSSLPGCSGGKVCRYSDASRALYMDSVQSTRGRIAKTTGVNSGSLTVDGNFSITSQNNTGTTFSGTIHKVGRTTGWTSGSVSNTCATVNVSGSNIQLLCQTLVQHNSSTIVGGGDSGSGAFRITNASLNEVELVGVLWGGSTDGRLFVFSPLSGIISELGGMTATFDGSGGGDDPVDPDPDPPPCTPRGNSGKCK